MRYSSKSCLFGVGLLAALGGCATIPNSGPSTGAINKASQERLSTGAIVVSDLTTSLAQQLADGAHIPQFASDIGDGLPLSSLVGRGDVLDVSIWEAPFAVLFGSNLNESRLAQAATQTSRNAQLPEQMVSSAGTITIPFVGSIQAAGRSTDAIAQDIRARLIGKANEPQVLVRIARNAATNVTVVGEVANSVRMPLTAKGERLLDALAAAGGVRQPVGKMTVQMTRGDHVVAMPLTAVIRDPKQNVRLQTDDIVTLLFQPYSFTVLGAARKNEEIPFEATGMTLSQALGRMGGLDDQRANPRGIFIFRFEDAAVAEQLGQGDHRAASDGKVPVIYRVDMRDPKTLFVAQSFLIKDKDVIYISNSPLADFSKFLQAVSQIVYPIATIQNTNIF